MYNVCKLGTGKCFVWASHHIWDVDPFFWATCAFKKSFPHFSKFLFNIICVALLWFVSSHYFWWQYIGLDMNKLVCNLLHSIFIHSLIGLCLFPIANCPWGCNSELPSWIVAALLVKFLPPCSWIGSFRIWSLQSRHYVATVRGVWNLERNLQIVLPFFEEVTCLEILRK